MAVVSAEARVERNLRFRSRATDTTDRMTQLHSILSLL